MKHHPRRAAMLANIRTNIERFGLHIYVIAGKQVPRVAYTIGLSAAGASELVFAGTAGYSTAEVGAIINAVASKRERASGTTIRIDPYGSFSLGVVDPSWAALLILGAHDYYGTSDIPVLQIVPDHEHWTVDVPDLSASRDPDFEPVWRWLTEPWPYPVPASSTAVTDLNALRGELVTEATRWEEDEWELFAQPGPEVDKIDMRTVPLGTLLGADPTLERVISLEIGKDVWREPIDLVWNDREIRSS